MIDRSQPASRNHSEVRETPDTEPRPAATEFELPAPSPVHLTVPALSADRVALAAHVASLALGGALILWLDRHMWFLYDEWAFFSTMHPALERGDWTTFLFAPYINHWVTIPNLIWEAVYRTVGMRVYAAYVLPVIAAHLILVAMVRAILRRAGVNAWLATAVSILVLIPGAGAGLVTFGWQIEFLGSLVFGLAQLLAIDHDGPLDRRDALGVAFGLLGLMCSSVSLAIVGAVGINLVLRSRWMAAGLAVCPLVGAFIIWYIAIGHLGSLPPTAAQLALVPRFVWTGTAATLDGLVGMTGIAGVLILGTLLLAARHRLGRTTPGMSVIYSMAAAGVLFFGITAYGRVVNGIAYAAESRYLYVGTVLFVPLIGVVMSRVVAGPGPTLVLIGFMAWALAVNLTSLYLYVHDQTVRAQNLRHVVEQLVMDPRLSTMDPSRQVPAEGAMSLTIGVVQRLHREHQLP